MTLSPERCFNSLADLLAFLVQREEQSSSSSVAWYESASTRAVEASFVNSGLAIAFVRDRKQESQQQQQQEQQTESSSQPIDFESQFHVVQSNSQQQQQLSASTNDTIRAVVVEELRSQQQRQRTVSIIIDEEFARNAAAFADSEMRKMLLLLSKEANSVRKRRRIAAVRLFIAPNNYQAWNWIKELHVAAEEDAAGASFSMSLWRSEMAFNAVIFSRLAKSPDSWAHRIWLMQRLFRALSSTQSVLLPLSHLIAIVSNESQLFAARASATHKRCYPSWEYRRVIWALFVDYVVGLSDDAASAAATSALSAEFTALLSWIESNPSDASAVSNFAELFRKVVSSSAAASPLSELLTTTLHAAWLQSQRMIRRHCFLDKLKPTVFVTQNLSHETVWFLRRAVIELASRGTETTFILYRGWTVEDEIEFVSSIVEMHEVASKIIEDEVKQSNNADADAEKTVLRLALTADTAAPDQGEFAALHATRYLVWLLRRF